MNELEKIYLEREQMYLKLFAEGKSWEEAKQIVDKQDFDERIEKICPSVKKKVLILTKSYYEHPELYPKYDNYNAINVNRLEDIPYDYEGIMGVPITYTYYHNKPIICQIKPISEKISQIIQFEIIRFRKGNDEKDLSINGYTPYFRILIKKVS